MNKKLLLICSFVVLTNAFRVSAAENNPSLWAKFEKAFDKWLHKKNIPADIPANMRTVHGLDNGTLARLDEILETLQNFKKFDFNMNADENVVEVAKETTKSIAGVKETLIGVTGHIVDGTEKLGDDIVMSVAQLSATAQTLGNKIEKSVDKLTDNSITLDHNWFPTQTADNLGSLTSNVVDGVCVAGILGGAGYRYTQGSEASDKEKRGANAVMLASLGMMAWNHRADIYAGMHYIGEKYGPWWA